MGSCLALTRFPWSFRPSDLGIAQEIADDFEMALEQFREIAADSSNGKSSPPSLLRHRTGGANRLLVVTLQDIKMYNNRVTGKACSSLHPGESGWMMQTCADIP
jgi:hypothetical protein